MNQTNVRSWFDYGRLDTQTSQTGLVLQQCYCKDIQLMKRFAKGELLSWDNYISLSDFQASSPLPTRSKFHESDRTLHGIMPIPSLQLQKKTSLTQRSRRFGHAVVVSKICYNAVFVLFVVTCNCCKPMNHCRD